MVDVIESKFGLERVDRALAGEVNQRHEFVMFGLAQEFLPFTEIKEPIL